MPVLEAIIDSPIRHTVTDNDFSVLKQYDANPIHFDDKFAKSLGLSFRERIAHGALPVAIVADEVNLMHGQKNGPFANPYWGLTEISLDFKAPVYVGDELTPLVKSSNGNGYSKLEIACIKSTGETVIEGKLSTGTPILGRPFLVLNPLDFIALISFYNRYVMSQQNIKKTLEQGDYFIKDVLIDAKRIKKDSEVLTDIGKGMKMISPLVLISGALGNDFPGRGTIYLKQSGIFYSDGVQGRNAVDLVVRDVQEREKNYKIKLGTDVYDVNAFPYGIPLPIFKGEATVLVPKVRNSPLPKYIN